MDINETYKLMLKDIKPSGKASKTAQEVVLNATELEVKQLAILKAIAKISKQKNREFNLMDIFHKGMTYTTEEGTKKIAQSDGFRYAGVTKAGKQFVGVWRI